MKNENIDFLKEEEHVLYKIFNAFVQKCDRDSLPVVLCISLFILFGIPSITAGIVLYEVIKNPWVQTNQTKCEERWIKGSGKKDFCNTKTYLYNEETGEVKELVVKD